MFGKDLDNAFVWGGLVPLRHGAARGKIVAGNLSLVCSLFGTDFAFELDGAVLVLEDVDEPLYRLDRMLQQLLMQREFKGVRGIAFGSMGATDGDVMPLLRDFAKRVDVPCVAGFPTGHKERCDPVPIGVEGYVDADVGVFRVTENPYS